MRLRIYICNPSWYVLFLSGWFTCGATSIADRAVRWVYEGTYIAYRSHFMSLLWSSQCMTSNNKPPAQITHGATAKLLHIPVCPAPPTHCRYLPYSLNINTSFSSILLWPPKIPNQHNQTTISHLSCVIHVSPRAVQRLPLINNKISPRQSSQTNPDKQTRVINP